MEKHTEFTIFIFVFLMALSFTSAVSSVVYNSPLNSSVYISELPVFNASINVSYNESGISLNGADGVVFGSIVSSQLIEGLNNWSAFFILSEGSEVSGPVQYFYYFSNVSSFADYNNKNSGLFVKYNSPLNGSYTNQSPIFNATIDVSYNESGISLNGADGVVFGSIVSSQLIEGLNNWSAFFILSEGSEVIGPVQYFYYDTTPPVITLIGSDIINITVGDVYSDLGATAEDNLAENITSRINVLSDVDTSIVGTYIVQYNVSDDAGNVASVIRTVYVNEAPVTTTSSGSSGGGGSCSTQWTVSEWSECTNGVQTRTVSYPTNYCAPRSDKPSESRTCAVSEEDNSNSAELESKEQSPAFFSTLTGAVIGTTAGRWSLGIIIFLIVIGLAYWIVAKKRKAVAKPAPVAKVSSKKGKK